MSLAYIHVDVFSERPFSGNSLPVFPDAHALSGEQMLRITQEMRHFEAVFLQPTDQPGTVRARIFDLLDELPFAGHPIIGAAAVLHQRSGVCGAHSWQFQLPSKRVEVTTEVTSAGYTGLLDQGPPDFLGPVHDRGQIAGVFNLAPDDLASNLPMEVVSTGLRYLVVPVVPGALARARISSDITETLRVAGAQFAVLLDESAGEIRHWTNDGLLEDVATGSAAGTIGAYRLRHGLARGAEEFVLHQGRFTGRPSILRVVAEGSANRVDTVKVGGDVCVVGHGVIEVLP